MSYSHSEPDVAPAQAGHGEGVSHVEPDDIGVGLLTVLFAFVAVVVLLVVVLLQAWFYNWKVELPAQRTGPIDAQQTPAAIAEKQSSGSKPTAGRTTRTRPGPFPSAGRWNWSPRSWRPSGTRQGEWRKMSGLQMN